MLANFNNIFLANIFYYSKVKAFQAHLPLMEKGRLFLLAKCVKNACGRVTF